MFHVEQAIKGGQGLPFYIPLSRHQLPTHAWFILFTMTQPGDSITYTMA